MKGIQTAPPVPIRNSVKVLLSGTESESLEFVRRHRDNAAWLKLAEEIESGKPNPRGLVLAIIKALRENLCAEQSA